MTLSAEEGYPVTRLASFKDIPACRYLRISSTDFRLVLTAIKKHASAAARVVRFVQGEDGESEGTDDSEEAAC
jgi:hypothetical protein